MDDFLRSTDTDRHASPAPIEPPDWHGAHTDARTPSGRAGLARLRAIATHFERAGRHGAATVVLAAAGVVGLRGEMPTPVMALWLIAVVVLAAWQRRLARRFFAEIRPPDAAAAWRRRIAREALASGVVWGAGGAGVVLAAPPHALPGWFLVFGGVLAVALAARFALAGECTAFLAIASAPSAVLLIVEGTRHATVHALLLVALVTVAIALARGLSARQARIWTLEQETAELAGVIHALRPAGGPVAHPQRGPDASARTLLDAVGEALLLVDGRGAVIYLNPSARRLGGWSGADLGKPLGEVLILVDEISRERRPDPAQSALRALTSVVLDDGVCLVHGDDHNERSVSVTATPIPAPASGDPMVLVRIDDVTEVEGLSRLMAFQSSHDLLTGLVNRSEFERRLTAIADGRTGGREDTLCCLGLDQLDMVNDACGHPAGDALLKEIASTLQGLARGADVVARMGGDQFLILLAGCDLQRAEVVANSYREAIGGLRFPWEGRVFRVSASVGIAPAPRVRAEVTDAISAAGAASHAAQQRGGNRIHVYQPDSDDALQHRELAHWMDQIRNAVEESRLQLLVQPIQALARARAATSHGELLVRIVDADGALVAPESFIHAAERYRLMPAVDRWVLREAFAALADESSALAALDVCAINLSGQSLSDPDFRRFVDGELDWRGIEPRRIAFEITETALVENMQAAMEFLETVRGRGCRVALDDFGSGLSSYAYLKHLPVDFLKIDGGFVRGMLETPTDRAVVASINQIGHALGLETIAEFCVSREILDELRRMGVDYAQGSAIGEPRPVVRAGAAPVPHQTASDAPL